MKIGFVSMPYSGHLNPMTALARKLQSRGHEIVVIGVPDIESVVLASGLNFISFCEEEYPAGSLTDLFFPASKLHGMAAVEYTCANIFPGLVSAGLEHLDNKITETDVEALVIDTVHFFLELVPINRGIPYLHIWNILPMDLSGSTPPCFFNWPLETTPGGLARNADGVKTASKLFGPMIAVAKPYAEKMGIDVDWSNPASTISKLGVISQTLREFDFPGIPWPPNFHYAGPFHDDAGRETVPFPWEDLNGKPFVYASLGTVVNGQGFMYRAILSAIEALPDIQLVLSIGKYVEFDDLGVIPSNAIVVRAAPQLELLKRATLCITHAGLNTTLESLARGVPLVAIPIGYDQPGIAARIAYHGVGEFLEIDALTGTRLSDLIQKVLTDPSYRERAQYFQKAIAETRGLDIAADVIEWSLSKTRN